MNDKAFIGAWRTSCHQQMRRQSVFPNSWLSPRLECLSSSKVSSWKEMTAYGVRCFFCSGVSARGNISCLFCSSCNKEEKETLSFIFVRQMGKWLPVIVNQTVRLTQSCLFVCLFTLNICSQSLLTETPGGWHNVNHLQSTRWDIQYTKQQGMDCRNQKTSSNLKQHWNQT